MSGRMEKRISKFKKLFPEGLRGKIFRLCLIVIANAMVLFVVLDMMQLQLLWKTAQDNSDSQAKMIKEQSLDSLEKSTEVNLTQTAIQAADNTDWELNVLRHDAVILADQTEKILREPWKYSEYDVDPPKKENGGKYTLQLLRSEDADISDEDMALIRKLASLGPMMEEMIADNDYHTQDMGISLTNGITLLMDDCSDQKIDGSGNEVYFDATTRPCWKGAVEAKKIYFSPVNFSATNKTAEFEIGIPIYIDGELAAVVETAMELDTLQEIVSKVTYGENGFSVIVSGDGKVIYSPRKEGDLKMDGVYSRDIRDSGNTELTMIVGTALKGETGYKPVRIDGEEYYVAYAPMNTVNWTEMMFISKKELEAPTNALLSRMDDATQTAFSHYRKSYFLILLMSSLLMILLVWATAVLARMMSRRHTGPINHMIAALGNMTKERFFFEMEDTYRTGDEIEVLAETFDELSARTLRYIDEITEITAEKERIGAELDVATRIQADMLPADFPAFPDLDEFELFASMTPAKEVGGDFYDFFLVDDDHLALVIADVSGKGVPAALFMVIAKTLIKNAAQLGKTPSEIFSYVNEQLCDGNKEEFFVTAWMGIIEISTGKGTAANAGHEHPAIRRNGGEWELAIYKHSPALAAMDGISFKEHEFLLNPGDSLFVYTDGVPEATNKNGELFGTDRMVQALNEKEDAAPDELLPHVKKRVDDFVGDAPQFDDLTMLGIKWLGTDSDC